MLQSALPLELCGMIIDNLHDGQRTLSVCALVCRDWVSFSRSRQFHTLVLSVVPRQRDKKLLLISDPSSTIPPYVRHLVMRQVGGRVLRLHLAQALWIDEALPCIRVDDLIALDFLELSGVDLAKLSPEVTRRLHCLCQRPRIVSLRNFGERSVVALLRLLAMCRSMEIFHASGMHEDISQLTVAVPDSESFTIPPRLHTIELGGMMYSSMGALLHCKDITHAVHTVRFTGIGYQDAPYVAALLERFGPTVEQVTLNLSNMLFREQHAEVIFCNAGGLLGSTGVRVINLSGNPAYLLSILKQVRSPLIERVSFHTTVPSSVDSFDANALDALFSRVPFASAQFQVLVADEDVQPLIDAREKVFAMFKNLREQGRLEFERAGGHPMDPATPPIEDLPWAAPFPSLVLAP
ncbi:hypothetical protein FOMPIDRAFT_98656 [Fomitopsis schrenkii]|uniref:F-box domain-containing protein n=1 Tax=Fomitopsis schrenkii TaxID=2126942 RepID=S8FN80_FOMSC|nr:hypothetical protein FOMPIDRAFT_98656 [Fomitopsis schrenkii]